MISLPAMPEGTMVNRREFFSGFLKSKARQPAVRPARIPRYRSLETHVFTEIVPYDRPLTPEQDRALRARLRRTLEASPDADLFSTVIVKDLEKVTMEFLEEIESESPG